MKILSLTSKIHEWDIGWRCVLGWYHEIACSIDMSALHSA